MATVHRVVFAMILLTIFLIILVLQLDGAIRWNWFLVFIPVWLLDCAMLIHDSIALVRNVQLSAAANSSTVGLTVRQSAWAILLILLQFLWAVAICLRLDYDYESLRFTFVMIPLWILLIALFCSLVYRIVKYFN